MEFQTWSAINKEAISVLKPQMGTICWDMITEEDKNKIWQYLCRDYFFDKTPKYSHNAASWRAEQEYCFEGEQQVQETKRTRIAFTIVQLNSRFKKQSYGANTLEEATWFNVCLDFYSIFMKMPGHAVLELLSIYCEGLLTIKREYEYSYTNESKKAFEKRIEQWRSKEFDEFATDLNEIFSQFSLDVYLTKQGFMPLQEKKIIEMVYKPVLSVFSDSKWKEVNGLITLSFKEYEKKTPEGFSFCITTTVSAVQAFLQMLVNGKTGKGEISGLMSEAQRLGKIPSDSFSQTIFKNIDSIVARERQDKSVAHPPQNIANEKNALLMLNLAMVFFQHCLVTTS